MNALASECSSGCESGWTLYLEHSFLSPNASRRDTNGFVIGKNDICDEHNKDTRAKESEEEEEEEEEDLSMVSDASSGPPHLPEDHEGYFNNDNACFYPASRAATLAKAVGKRQKIKEHRLREDQEHTAFLDDTASSPVINFSRNNFTLTNNNNSMESDLDFSQGFSATHFEGTSAFQDHLGFLQSSLSANQLQNNQWFEGKRFGMR